MTQHTHRMDLVGITILRNHNTNTKTSKKVSKMLIQTKNKNHVPLGDFLLTVGTGFSISNKFFLVENLYRVEKVSKRIGQILYMTGINSDG